MHNIICMYDLIIISNTTNMMMIMTTTSNMVVPAATGITAKPAHDKVIIYVVWMLALGH